MRGNTPYGDPQQHERGGRTECRCQHLRSFDNCFDISSAGRPITSFFRPEKTSPTPTASVITPLFITLLITTPPTPSCGCAEVLSHSVVYHLPFVIPASCTSSPGLHNMPHPPQDTAPGDIFFTPQTFSPGCGFLQYTVEASREVCPVRKSSQYAIKMAAKYYVGVPQ